MTLPPARCVCAFLMIVAPATAVAQHPSKAHCKATWTTPRALLTRDRHPLYSDTPHAVLVRGGYAFFSQTTFEWMTPDRFYDSTRLARDPSLQQKYQGQAGLLLRDDGSGVLIPRPAFDGTMVATRAVAGKHRVAHVVWGETSDTSGWYRASHALWYAQYDGVTWSVPERITTDYDVWWSVPTAGYIVVDNEPRIAVAAAPHGEQGVFGGLLTLRREGGRWQQTYQSNKNEPRPTYVALAHDPVGGDVLAWLGNLGPQHAVVVRRSADGGKTWDAPMAADALGSGQGYDLQFVTTGHDMYLMWASKVADAAQVESVRTMRSSDFGRSWQEAPSLKVPGGFDGLQAIGVTNTGDVRVVVRGHQPAAPLSAALRDGQWSALERIGPEIASLPAISVLTSDSVLVGWGVMTVQHLAGRAIPVPALRLSVLRADCPVVPRARDGRAQPPPKSSSVGVVP